MIDLIKYLPIYERESVIEQAKMQAVYNEFKRLVAYKESLLKEMYISTSEEYLFEWEQILGLPTVEFECDEQDPDYDAKYEQYLTSRRNSIQARLRGYGTVTKELIERICNSYWDGQVEVICIYSEYTVQINFENKPGIPAFLNEILERVREILPAHLALENIYRPRTWQEVKDGAATWADLLSHTWQDIYDKEDVFNG